MKQHIKVIQRNGVDIFVTSSARYEKSKLISVEYQYGNLLGEMVYSHCDETWIKNFHNEYDRDIFLSRAKSAEQFQDWNYRGLNE